MVYLYCCCGLYFSLVSWRGGVDCLLNCCFVVGLYLIVQGPFGFDGFVFGGDLACLCIYCVA